MSAIVARIQIDSQKQYEVGDKIECNTFQKMKWMAFRLSSKGYGVAVIGLHDIEEHTLTITEVPEGEDNGTFR